MAKSNVDVGATRERAADGGDPNRARGQRHGMIQSAGRPSIPWAGSRSVAAKCCPKRDGLI
jgi:hypothetical protein